MRLMQALAAFYKAPGRREVRQARQARLALETLEGRAVPAIDVWIGPNGGNWSTDANWSLGVKPANDDIVLFTTALGGGSNTSCTIDVNTASLLEIYCDTGYTATITVFANLTVTAATSFTQNGTLLLSGGETISVGDFA